MKKRYLFFLRHYNDIDNIAPAIYYFLEADKENVADVIIYHNYYDYRDDENLLYLKKKFGKQFSYCWLGVHFGLNPDSYFVNNGLTKKNTGLKDLVVSSVINVARKVYHLIYKKTGISLTPLIFRLKQWRQVFAKSEYEVQYSKVCTGDQEVNEDTKRVIGDIIKEKGLPSLVIFDVNRTQPVRCLLYGLRQNGVKRIICLPVSPLINYNTLRSDYMIDIKSERFLTLHDYSGFDKIGYVDHYYADSNIKTFELLGQESSLKGRTKALGSIRFSPDWVNRKEAFVSYFERDTAKIKVVFFLSHKDANVNWKEVEHVFQFLKNFPEYDVVVKHHTRDEANEDMQRFPHLTFVNAENSSSLINWADVVLFWSTSVAIEGYIKSKTMVCLSYLCCNTSLYALYDAGFMVHCRDDLHKFLALYVNRRSEIRYNKEGAVKLLDEAIIPGGDKVIQNYLNFMAENESL